MIIFPLTAATLLNILSKALLAAPADVYISKSAKTCVPLIDILNSLCPAAVKYVSANFKETWYDPAGTLKV
jgi:hypothetical protein